VSFHGEAIDFTRQRANLQFQGTLTFDGRFSRFFTCKKLLFNFSFFCVQNIQLRTKVSFQLRVRILELAYLSRVALKVYFQSL